MNGEATDILIYLQTLHRRLAGILYQIAVWSPQNFDMCGVRVDRSRESKSKTHTVKVNAIVSRMWLDGTGLEATL